MTWTPLEDEKRRCPATGLPYVRTTTEALQSLPEYSRTMPTALTPGKRWRRWQSLTPPGHPSPRSVQIVGLVTGQAENRWGQTTAEVSWYRPLIVCPPEHSGQG